MAASLEFMYDKSLRSELINRRVEVLRVALVDFSFSSMERRLIFILCKRRAFKDCRKRCGCLLSTIMALIGVSSERLSEDMVA